MQSQAKTVAGYLASLPADRRAAISAVRQVILDNLDPTYVEGMQYGMIGYAVPHSAFPAGYHCDPRQPLPFAGLASQKQSMSLYLMCTYASDEQRQWFETAWAKTGKPLDMGKSCLRFKSLDDLALDVIGAAIKRVPARKFIAHYEAALAGTGRGRSARAGQGPSKGRAGPRSKVSTVKRSARRASR